MKNGRPSGTCTFSTSSIDKIYFIRSLTNDQTEGTKRIYFTSTLNAVMPFLRLTWCIFWSQANRFGNAVDSLEREVLKGDLGVLMKKTLLLEKVIMLGAISEGRRSVNQVPEEYHTHLHLRCL